MLGKLHRKIFICFMGSILFLSACSSHTPWNEAAVRDTVKQGYEEYAAVLLEDAEFFDATAQEYRHLSDYMPPLFRHRLLSTSDFCPSDIDNDGTEEVFLQYDSLDSYLVFDYEDGTVNGYCFHQPELQNLEFCLKIHEGVGPYINLWRNETFCKILFFHGEYKLRAGGGMDKGVAGGRRGMGSLLQSFKRRLHPDCRCRNQIPACELLLEGYQRIWRLFMEICFAGG